MNNIDFGVDAAGYHYEVFEFTKDSKDIIHTAVLQDNYFIKQASPVESSLHDIVVACTYSRKAKSGGMDGIFLVEKIVLINVM